MQALLHLWIGRHDGFAQVVEIDLGAGIEQGGEQGDADGTAEVAQDVEQAGGRASVLRHDIGRSDQRNRDHHQRLAQRADDLDVLELFAGEVQVEHAGEETRRAEQGEAQGAQPFRRNDLHQLGHQRNQEQLRHTHPHDHFADLHGVVALDLRQVQRQHIDRSIKAHAEPQAGNTGQAEVALAQYAQVDQRFRAGDLQDDEQDQADQRHAAEADDQLRLQPVLAMASRLQAREHSSEAIRKPTDTHTARRRAESSCTSQAVSGIMMISATR